MTRQRIDPASSRDCREIEGMTTSTDAELVRIARLDPPPPLLVDLWIEQLHVGRAVSDILRRVSYAAFGEAR